MQQETLIPLPANVAPVSSVRSTLPQSSLNALRKRGHIERYLSLLDPQYKSMLLETLAPEWLPVAAAHAHYAACDALHLPEPELREIGEEVGERIQGTFIGTLVRSARSMGLTPWIPLGQFSRLLQRLMQGGAVELTKLGPKDCRVDVRQVGLLQHGYFRTAFCGVITAAIKLGAGRSASVRLVSGGSYAARCVVACAWV